MEITVNLVKKLSKKKKVLMCLTLFFFAVFAVLNIIYDEILIFKVFAILMLPFLLFSPSLFFKRNDNGNVVFGEMYILIKQTSKQSKISLEEIKRIEFKYDGFENDMYIRGARYHFRSGLVCCKIMNRQDKIVEIEFVNKTPNDIKRMKEYSEYVKSKGIKVQIREM